MASVGQHVVTGRRCRAGGLRSLGWWMTNGSWSEPAACAAAHEGFTGPPGKKPAHDEARLVPPGGCAGRRW